MSWLRRLWKRMSTPPVDPPCTNTRCEQYGAKYRPCADIDAWTSH